MSGTAPKFEDWRQFSSIEVWEIAAMIHGFDPRAVGDVVVPDPLDPTNSSGVASDTSWTERALVSGIQVGALASTSENVASPNIHTNISVSSLIPWLRANGYHDLAAELDTQPVLNGAHGSSTGGQSLPVVPEPQRRLTALRELGGEAKWKRYRGSQQWTFTKIKILVAQEKHAKKLRSDEKTIRKDLTEAAAAESMKRRSGPTP
jgi:hypothetical protein